MAFPLLVYFFEKYAYENETRHPSLQLVEVSSYHLYSINDTFHCVLDLYSSSGRHSQPPTVMKTLLFLSVVLVVTFTEALDPNNFQCTKSSPTDGDVFSDGDPPVNMVHIFCGQIIKGKATGFHSHPGGNDPDCAKVTGQPDKPPANNQDYAEYPYDAIFVKGEEDCWIQKHNPNSFWPTSMTIPVVVDKIQYLYNSCKPDNNEQTTVCIEDFFLLDNYKFDVEIHLKKKKVKTAYPRETGHCKKNKGKKNVKTCKFGNHTPDEL